MGPMAAVKILSGLGFGQAVKAAEIAPVCQTDPQVAQNTTMGIDQQPFVAHLAGAELVSARVGRGGITFTEPSAPTSTLRSYAGRAALAGPGMLLIPCISF